MSLRYKLLILMLTLTGVSLAAFLALAVYLFEQDKVAYVFDSSAENSKSLANQVKTELRMRSAEMVLFVSGFDFAKKSFDRDAFNTFDKKESLSEVRLNKWDGKTYETIAVMRKSDYDAQKAKTFDSFIDQVQSQAFQDSISFKVVSTDEGYLLYSQKVSMEGDPVIYFITVVDHNDSLSLVLKKSAIFENYIARSDGTILLQSANNSPVQSLNTWAFFKKISGDSLPDGSEETTNLAGKPSLVSYSKLGIGNLISISAVDKSLAFQAVDTLLLKAGLFFVALISLSAILAIIFSRQVTSQLMTLDLATTELANGNFDVELDIKSKDEVGRLSNNFNTMVSKISVLMKDNVEKARMEKELETAKVVQDTLFPDRNSKIDRVQISGYYEPASECGGDWWYYFKSGTKVFICIGDATGHGASAALITSAARSAVSLIETSPTLTPSTFLQLLNRAIYVSAKGKIQMTFFVASIEPEKGLLTYATASHTAPYLLKKKTGQVKKNDLVPLLGEAQGLRLGQEINSRYTESYVELSAGDLVFVYTDGLTDIESPEGKVWDERGLIKSLVNSLSENTDPKFVVENVSNQSNEFRNMAALKDDVTFFAFQYL